MINKERTSKLISYMKKNRLQKQWLAKILGISTALLNYHLKKGLSDQQLESVKTGSIEFFSDGILFFTGSKNLKK